MWVQGTMFYIGVKVGQTHSQWPGRDDETAMRPFAALLWTLVFMIIGLKDAALHLLGSFFGLKNVRAYSFWTNATTVQMCRSFGRFCAEQCL